MKYNPRFKRYSDNSPNRYLLAVFLDATRNHIYKISKLESLPTEPFSMDFLDTFISANPALKHIR